MMRYVVAIVVLSLVFIMIFPLLKKWGSSLVEYFTKMEEVVDEHEPEEPDDK